MGYIVFPGAQSLNIAFHGGRGLGCTGYTSLSTDALENFPNAIENAQRVKLFICSKLFISVLEILNHGGPGISRIFLVLFLLLCQRHKKGSS